MTLDRTRLSFEEAEGKPVYPTILKWGQIDQRIRASLWNIFFPFFDRHTIGGRVTVLGPGGGIPGFLEPPLRSMVAREYLDRQHGYIDQFSELYPDKQRFMNFMRSLFQVSDYIQLFGFVSFLLRDEDCPIELIDDVRLALDKPFSPYRLISNPPTIIPALSEEQVRALTCDVDRVFLSRFAGAKTHLQAALDAFGIEDYRGVVREAIHSVESAVRDFTQDQNAVLSRALRKLTDDGMHKALLDAFEKLYGYSSDENGIRHALVLGDNAKVGFDEATFFLSACSAFVAFLSGKARAAD